MNCDTARDRETYRFYQAAINALELRLVEDSPGCTVPPKGFIPRACKDTALTAFAQLGALRLDVNRGLISLLDGRYQYILAEATRTLTLLPNIEPDPEDDLWLGSVIIPRSKGICEHVLSLGDMVHEPSNADPHVPAVIINDLADDPRFWNRPYVRSEPGVRFYAGVPLRNPWGAIIGVYCVFGHEPRDGLTQEQLLALQGIATTVMTYLETSKAKEGHRRYEQMLHGLTSFVTGEPSIHLLDHQQASTEQGTTLHQTPGHDPAESASAASSSPDIAAQKTEDSTTSAERNSSPKNKKRPRVLSTASGVQFLQDTRLDAYQAGMLDSVAMCGKTLLDTIDHVLDFAKVNTFNKLPTKALSKRMRDTGDSSPHPSDGLISEPESLTTDVDLAMLAEEVVEAVFAGQAHRGAFSRLEQTSGRSAARPQTSSAQVSFPPGMTQQARDLDEASKKIVRVVLDIPHRIEWTLTTQPGAWRRVFMNLVGNAIKYTKSGYIRITMRSRQPELNAKKDSNNAEITLIVADTGKGISAEYLRGGLWKPFSQEDSFSPGTGLGLSIVHQIVHSLKGKIDLKSEVQVGTEIKIVLSVALAKDPPNSDDEDRFLPLAIAQLKGRPVCILETTNPDGLKDTSPTQQKGRRELSISLARTLKGWFGADAVVSTILTAVSADVIICLEPDVEFLATLKIITSTEKRPLIVFIALDGTDTAKLRADSRLQGGDFVVDIITQPCGPRKLAKSLSQALERRDKHMPLTVTPLASPIRMTPEQPPTDSHTRILLVDAFMRRYNFYHEEAMNGLEAVERYKQANGQFDYVLMGIAFPSPPTPSVTPYH
ncbi:hypothetical protein SLS57_006445 [Botryosphaeria dothidea]